MTKVRWPLASMTAVICAAALCFSMQSFRTIAAENQLDASASEIDAKSDGEKSEKDKAATSKNKKSRKEAAPKKKVTKATRQPAGTRGVTGQRGGGIGGSMPTGGSGSAQSGKSSSSTSPNNSGGSESSESTEGNSSNSNVGRNTGGDKKEPQLPGDAPYPDDVKKALEIQSKHSPELLKTKGINGVATGLGKNGKPAIIVSLTGADNPKVPATIEGIPVETEVIGPIFDHYDGFAGSSNFSPKVRIKRPIAIGVSGINFTGCDSVCATGTIGCRLRAKDGSGLYALSNNHVFADNNLAPIGSLVVQPGPADNTCQCISADQVGTLFRFKEKDFNGGLNRMDAAIMKTTADLVSNSTLPDGYGKPRTYTIKRAQLGMNVMKYGRTTGFTKGRITGINAFTSSIAATGQLAFYSGQIIVRGIGGTFSAGGDSGSLIVTEDRFPVGLLFSGSGNRTIANPIQEVLDEFGMEIDGDDSTDFPVPGKSGRTQPDSN